MCKIALHFAQSYSTNWRVRFTSLFHSPALFWRVPTSACVVSLLAFSFIISLDKPKHETKPVQMNLLFLWNRRFSPSVLFKQLLCQISPIRWGFFWWLFANAEHVYQQCARTKHSMQFSASTFEFGSTPAKHMSAIGVFSPASLFEIQTPNRSID